MNIQARTVEKLYAQLTNLGAEAFVRFDGRAYGKLPEIQAKPKPKTKGMGKEIRAALKNLKPGEVTEVPFNHWPKKQFRALVSATCIHLWGRGNAATCVNNAKQVVEVLRLA